MSEESLQVIESWEVVGAGAEKVTEEAIAKVNEEARQARQVAQQLIQDKAKNAEFAEFLTFLLWEISNDEIISALYDAFFITIDPKTNTTYLRKTMNTIVVIWLFYPFYVAEAEHFGVAKHFSSFLPETPLTIRKYMHYLGQLSTKYHDNIPVNQPRFIDLLVLIVREYLRNVEDFPVLSEDMGVEEQKMAIRKALS